MGTLRGVLGAALRLLQVRGRRRPVGHGRRRGRPRARLPLVRGRARTPCRLQRARRRGPARARHVPLLRPRVAEPPELARDCMGAGRATADGGVQRLPDGVRPSGRVRLRSARRLAGAPRTRICARRARDVNALSDVAFA